MCCLYIIVFMASLIHHQPLSSVLNAYHIYTPLRINYDPKWYPGGDFHCLFPWLQLLSDHLAQVGAQRLLYQVREHLHSALLDDRMVILQLGHQLGLLKRQGETRRRQRTWQGIFRAVMTYLWMMLYVTADHFLSWTVVDSKRPWFQWGYKGHIRRWTCAIHYERHPEINRLSKFVVPVPNKNTNPQRTVPPLPTNKKQLLDPDAHFLCTVRLHIQSRTEDSPLIIFLRWFMQYSSHYLQARAQKPPPMFHYLFYKRLFTWTYVYTSAAFFPVNF